MPTRGTPTLVHGLIVLAAIWLFITPWVFTYDGDAGWNSTIVAAVIAAVAVLRLGGATRLPAARWLSWLNVVLGVWLVVAPWLLDDYDGEAKWNSALVGLVVIVLAAWDAQTARAAPG